MASRLATLLGHARRLLRPGETLAQRTVSGSVWLTAFSVVDRAVRLATYVALSHVLTPAEFGLVGLGTLALTVLAQTSRLGVEAALIQHEQADVDGYLDTAWVLTTARGVVLAALAFALAPPVASVFDAPELVAVVRALALVPLVTGVRNPGVVYFRKELAFDRQFSYAISGTVAFAVTAVGVALVSPSVWALVAATVAAKTTQTVASYVVHSYRPGLSFDRDDASELLGYGKWIFGSGVVLLLLNRGDDALVGWLLGSGALGLYQMAFRLSSSSTREVTDVVSGVAFPAFSRVQDDVEALREAFFRSVRVVASLSVPMAVGIAAVAPVFVRAFFGPEWLSLVPVIRVLAVWGVLRSLAATIGPLFRAIGRPEYNTYLQASRLLVLGAVVYPATARAGVVGAALALVVSGAVENPIAFALAVRVVDGQPRRLLRSLAVPTATSLLMGAVVVLAARGVTGLPLPVEFGLLVALGTLVYVTAVFALDRAFDVELANDVARLRTTIE